MLAPAPAYSSPVFNPEQFVVPTASYMEAVRPVRFIPQPPTSPFVLNIETYDELKPIFVFGANVTPPTGLSAFTVQLPPPTSPGYLFQFVVITSSTTSTLVTLTSTGDVFLTAATGTSAGPTKQVGAGSYTFISTGLYWALCV